MTRVRSEDILSHIHGESVILFLRGIGFDPVKKGREYKILCPFHADKDPSFCIVPSKKAEKGGIFKCFVCGWGGSVFDFVQQTHGLKDFVATLNFMASRLGITRDNVQAQRVAAAQRPVEQPKQATIMTPGEVSDVYDRCVELQIPPEPYANTLGVLPRAMTISDTVVIPGEAYGKLGIGRQGGKHPLCVIPMRGPTGEFYSLRFASMGPKEPKRKPDGTMRTDSEGKPILARARWSLNVREGKVAVKDSRSGFMAPFFQFESEPTPWSTNIWVEGETDLWAGLSMMLDAFGDPTTSDEISWPARWWGLPGANSCHELMRPALCCPSSVFFLDNDKAGHDAMFGRPVMRKVGEQMVPVVNEWNAGWLDRARGHGASVVACSPPLGGGAKKDLRDLYREGWKWTDLDGYILGNARTNLV